MMAGLFPGLQPVDQADAGSDVAYTPAGVVRALLAPSSPLPPPRRPVWEPCAGAGVWITELRAAGYTVDGTEIDSKALSVKRGLARQGDAMRGRDDGLGLVGRGGDYEIWTNPPFSIANDLVRAWIDGPNPPRRIVLLVLQAWIVAEERAWLWPYLRRQVLLYPRICFEGPGRPSGATDQREYAVIDLWVPAGGPARGLDRFDWRTRRAS